MDSCSVEWRVQGQHVIYLFSSDIAVNTFSAGWRGILDAGQLWLRPCSRRGARSVPFATFPDFSF